MTLLCAVFVLVGAAAGNRLYGGIGMWAGEAAGAGIFALLAWRSVYPRKP
jgi:hypothetical protein